MGYAVIFVVCVGLTFTWVLFEISWVLVWLVVDCSLWFWGCWLGMWFLWIWLLGYFPFVVVLGLRYVAICCWCASSLLLICGVAAF